MHWDPCGSLTAMTDASGSLVASFEYDKAYSRKINEHNPYGIEIPFQFDGRDGTMTATYGDTTPLALVLQVHSNSRISIGNLAPIQASGAMCCTLYGEGEEATSSDDGGADDECSEGEEDCDLDCEKGYKEGFTSMTDLCRCKEKEGKLHGYRYDDIKNADCEGLRNEMKDAKYDWDYHTDGPEDGGNDKDDKHHGHIEHMVDVLFYIGNPNNDYPCGTFVRDGCNYWTAKEELERRQDKGECLYRSST